MYGSYQENVDLILLTARNMTDEIEGQIIAQIILKICVTCEKFFLAIFDSEG